MCMGTFKMHTSKMYQIFQKLKKKITRDRRIFAFLEGF